MDNHSHTNNEGASMKHKNYTPEEFSKACETPAYCLELDDDLPEGCKDIGQIKSGSEIFAETMASFAAIFGVQK